MLTRSRGQNTSRWIMHIPAGVVLALAGLGLHRWLIESSAQEVPPTMTTQAGTADPSDGTTTDVRNKTLVAWVRLDNLDQTGSGVLSIQDGDEFDSVTFGERVQQRWMAGSHMFSRTQGEAEQTPLAPETAGRDQWLQIAVVYRGRQIDIWRNGERYVSYEALNQQAYSPACTIYLGLRCIFGQVRHGFLKGAIDEARIYTVALDGDAIAALRQGIMGTPEPLGCWTFDDGVAKDVMGHYPTTQLIGTARVEDGALRLDGRGFALVSERLLPEYKATTVQAGFYTPPRRIGEMWDTWIYWHDGVFTMYYLAGPGGHWDAHEIATSPDGVHWDYYGTAVKPRPGTAWIGTGHVWKTPTFEEDGLWVLNYSEWVKDKQDIMFATSPDLLHWTKVDESLRFVQDTRWYRENGRWDCIDTITGDDGWLYGYFTADPDPAKVDYQHCGFGFARSKDGIRWETLPPLPGDMNGEFGGIQKIGARYYITLSEGRVGVGDSLRGPFWSQKKNANVYGGTIYFPRFCHTAPDGPLMNHFYTQGPIYAGPLKAINIDNDGTMRLVWWPGNEKLKVAEIPAGVGAAAGAVQWLDSTIDVNQTTVIEGIVRLPDVGQADHALPGIAIDQGRDTVELVIFDHTQTLFGDAQMNPTPLHMTIRQTADRDIDFGREQRFRIVLNRDMMEVYVNDYLTILVRVNNTGRLGVIPGALGGDITHVKIWRSATERERPKPAVSEPKFGVARQPFFLPRGVASGDTFPVFVDGRWHLFNMSMSGGCFGHHSSADLIHWKRHPDTPFGGATGTVLPHDGRFYMFFTGPGQAVSLATSDDMDTWTLAGNNPVVQSDGQIYQHGDFRDPYVFFNEDEKQWWLLVGAREAGVVGQRSGCVGLAKSTNLLDWSLVEPLWAPRIGPHADCPQLLEHQGTWYLFYLQRFTRYRTAASLEGPWERGNPRNLDCRMAAAGSRPAFDGKRWISFPFIITPKQDAALGELGEWGYGGPLAVPREWDFHANTLITVHAPREIIEAMHQAQPQGRLPLDQARVLTGQWAVTVDKNEAQCLSESGGSLLLGGVPEHFYLEADLLCSRDTMDAHVIFNTDDTLESGYLLELGPDDDHAILRGISHWDVDRELVWQSVPLQPNTPTKIRIFRSGSVVDIFLGDTATLTHRLYRYSGGDIVLEFIDGSGRFENLFMCELGNLQTAEDGN